MRNYTIVTRIFILRITPLPKPRTYPGPGANSCLETQRVSSERETNADGRSKVAVVVVADAGTMRNRNRQPAKHIETFG